MLMEWLARWHTLLTGRFFWVWYKNRERWAVEAEVRREAQLAEMNRIAELNMPPLRGVMVTQPDGENTKTRRRRNRQEKLF